MQPGEFRPGDRKHLRCCVQLHGAGAERDHRMAKRQIARFESPQVTEHLGFGVMGVENWMSKELRSAYCELRNFEPLFIQIVVGEVADVSPAKKRHQFFYLVVGGRFIKRNSNSM